MQRVQVVQRRNHAAARVSVSVGERASTRINVIYVFVSGGDTHLRDAHSDVERRSQLQSQFCGGKDRR
jgi:hypothetical protein